MNRDPQNDGWDTAGWVLIVDDEPAIRDSASRWITRLGLRCLGVASAEKAIKALGERPFDVVVADVQLPGASGIEVLKRFKERDPDIQVIIITGRPTLDLAAEAVRSQADDYLTKPFELAHLGHSVERAVRHRRLRLQNRAYRRYLENKVRDQAGKIERLFQDSLQALTGAIEARGIIPDREEREHVARYAVSTASQLNVRGETLWSVWLAALLHDVGKLSLPDAILNKETQLSEDEFRQITRYPEAGAWVVDKVDLFKPAIPGILQHRERWDGSGYPKGLAGEAICIEARILAVCDAFDAMTSHRPYRAALSEERAIAELRRGSGKRFDPTVVQAFLDARENDYPRSDPPAFLSHGSRPTAS